MSTAAAPDVPTHPDCTFESESLCSSVGFGSPTMTSSACGIEGIARTMSSNPLRGTNLPTLTMRCIALLAAAGPSGLNR